MVAFLELNLMPNVLIVDDSPIDRVLIEGILKKDSRLKVRRAANGAEALALLGDTPPDLIVTDLQMPEMDGLALVTAVRIHFPQVPVILITAHGSEQLAVQALEQGAASYVPKSQLASGLVPAVDQVLELARSNRGYEALAQAMDYAEFRFRAGNDLALCDRLTELVQQLAGSIGVCDTGGQVRIGMALEEAFRMMVLRGNLELPPDLLLALTARQEDEAVWLEKRRAEQPYCERKVRIHVQVSPAELRLEIGHEGPPLELAEASESAAAPALESPSDRSLILMRAFMDEVAFSPDGKSVTLVKRNANA